MEGRKAPLFVYSAQRYKRNENHLGTIFHREELPNHELLGILMTFREFPGKTTQITRISRRVPSTPISMWPWCVLNLKCRCYDENDLLSAAAGGGGRQWKECRQRIASTGWSSTYIWRVMFVFNIKINESKQNNKSPQKLNCNDVVFISSSPSYAIQTDIQSIAGAAMSRRGWPGARSR